MKDKEKNIAKDLAFELLGNIEYGDTRDNPEWQEKVLKSAENIISQILQEEREKTIKECVKVLSKYLSNKEKNYDATDFILIQITKEIKERE